jgi:hypothetical protein
MPPAFVAAGRQPGRGRNLFQSPDLYPRLKGAALIFATLLATPYTLDYDLMLLAPAIMLLAARRGLLPFETNLAAVLRHAAKPACVAASHCYCAPR